MFNALNLCLVHGNRIRRDCWCWWRKKSTNTVIM